MPTLEITLANGDSMNMIESGAMIALLADMFPEKHLSPPIDDLSLKRAERYLQMLHFGSSWMDMTLWEIRYPRTCSSREETDQNHLAVSKEIY